MVSTALWCLKFVINSLWFLFNLLFSVTFFLLCLFITIFYFKYRFEKLCFKPWCNNKSTYRRRCNLDLWSEKIKIFNVLSVSRNVKKLHRWFLHQRRNKRKSTLNVFQRHHSMVEKKANVIRFLSSYGEKLSSQHKLVGPFLFDLEQWMKSMKLTRGQIYSANENGVYRKMIPGKTHVSTNEKTAPGRQLTKAVLHSWLVKI